MFNILGVRFTRKMIVLPALRHYGWFASKTICLLVEFVKGTLLSTIWGKCLYCRDSLSLRPRSLIPDHWEEKNVDPLWFWYEMDSRGILVMELLLKSHYLKKMSEEDMDLLKSSAAKYTIVQWWCCCFLYKMYRLRCYIIIIIYNIRQYTPSLLIWLATTTIPLILPWVPGPSENTFSFTHTAPWYSHQPPPIQNAGCHLEHLCIKMGSQSTSRSISNAYCKNKDALCAFRSLHYPNIICNGKGNWKVFHVNVKKLRLQCTENHLKGMHSIFP